MKIKNIILSVLFVSFAASCEDAYNIDAKDEIVDGNAITNMQQLSTAVVGAYGGQSGYRAVEWSAYFTDECRKPSTNRGQGVQVHTWSINDGTTEPSSIYSGFYSSIRRANAVLDKIPDVVTANDDEETLKNRYISELRFLRALSHFELMRFFSTSYDANALATPIVDRLFVFDELPRNTVGEVAAFVDSEIESLLPALLAGPSNSIAEGLVTPAAAYALRARLALYTKNYEAAVTYADQAIALVPLASSVGEFANIWNDSSVEGVILKFKRVSSTGSNIGLIFTGSNGDVFFNVSDGLFGAYTANDVRATPNVLFDPNSTLANIMVGKYLGATGSFGLNDHKIFRTAEMYLIKAEALALQAAPNFPLSVSTLNELRASRRVDPSAVPDVAYSTEAGAIDAILAERRIELAFEGHRFFDLKRFNRGVDRLASDVLLNDFAQNLPAGDYRFTLPIPATAMDANSALTQNAGY